MPAAASPLPPPDSNTEARQQQRYGPVGSVGGVDDAHGLIPEVAYDDDEALDGVNAAALAAILGRRFAAPTEASKPRHHASDSHPPAPRNAAAVTGVDVRPPLAPKSSSRGSLRPSSTGGVRSASPGVVPPMLETAGSQPASSRTSSRNSVPRPPTAPATRRRPSTAAARGPVLASDVQNYDDEDDLGLVKKSSLPTTGDDDVVAEMEVTKTKEADDDPRGSIALVLMNNSRNRTPSPSPVKRSPRGPTDGSTTRIEAWIDEQKAAEGTTSSSSPTPRSPPPPELPRWQPVGDAVATATRPPHDGESGLMNDDPIVIAMQRRHQRRSHSGARHDSGSLERTLHPIRDEDAAPVAPPVARPQTAATRVRPRPPTATRARKESSEPQPTRESKPVAGRDQRRATSARARPSSAAAAGRRRGDGQASANTPPRREEQQQVGDDVVASSEAVMVATDSVIRRPSFPNFMRAKQTLAGRVAAARGADAEQQHRQQLADATGATGVPAAPSTAAAKKKEERPAAWKAKLGRAKAEEAAKSARETVKPPAARRPLAPRIPSLAVRNPGASFLLDQSDIDARQRAVDEAVAAVVKTARPRRSQSSTTGGGDAVVAGHAAPSSATPTTPKTARTEPADADQRRKRMQSMFLQREPGAATRIASAKAAAAANFKKTTRRDKFATAQLDQLSEAQRAAVANDAARCIQAAWKHRCQKRCLLDAAAALRAAASEAQQQRVEQGVRLATALRVATRLQVALRAFVARFNRPALRVAVTQLQARWRGHCVRRQRILERLRSAVVVGATEKQEFERREFAALTIGRAWRRSQAVRWMARVTDIRRRSHALTIATWTRRVHRTVFLPAFETRMAALERRVAARKIQRAWRGYVSWLETEATAFRRRFHLA